MQENQMENRDDQVVNGKMNGISKMARMTQWNTVALG